MDPESALRLKKGTIRLKVEAIESIELKVGAIESGIIESGIIESDIELKLKAEESNPGAASPSFEGIDASGEDSVVEGQPTSVAALTPVQRSANFLRNLYPRWSIEIGYEEDYVIENLAIWLESDKTTIVDEWSPDDDDIELKRVYDALGGGTALHWAVRMEDLALVTGILAAGEVDVNALDEVWGATALHWAARIGNTAIVKAMLTDQLASRKFDLTVQDKCSCTALENAIFNGIKPKIFLVTELLKFKDSDHEYPDSKGVIGEVEEICQEGSSSIEVESRFESQRETWYGKVHGWETYLHWAMRMEDTSLAAHILTAGKIDVNAKDWRDRTALLCAVRSRNLDIVKIMVMKHLESGNFDVNYSEWSTSYTALHWAIVSGKTENMDMVKELLRCEATMRLTEECKWGKTPLQIAHERGFKGIQKTLMEREVVRRFVDDLYRDRQVYVDAANAILVGAALIASVTFASWLQPPLDNSPDYVNVQQHMGLGAFWVFNCLSFYFAIATVVFGACSVLPRSPYFIKQTVEKLRKNLLMTAILLACSVFFVIIAFGIAGCIVLIPIVKFQLYMIIPTIFGGLVCLISLGRLAYSMWNDSVGREHVARSYEWVGFVEGPYRAML